MKTFFLQNQGKRNKVSFLLAFLAGAFGTFASGYEIPPPQTQVNIQANTQVLKQISEALSSISEASKKALVYISISKTMKGSPPGMDPFDLFGFGGGRGGMYPPGPPPKQEGLGSGFLIDVDQGYILTNNHVVEEADEINLKLSNGESYAGKILGRDKNTDVAVVQITDKNFNKKGLSPLVLNDSDTLQVGAFVVALGAPFGLEASISFGVVSALGRGSLDLTKLGDFIQTDAAINPGNSGGPLIDMDGKVVGINTAIFSKSGGYNGIGFAVPANLVRKVASRLINQGSFDRGFIGLSYSLLKPEWGKNLNLPAGIIGVYVSNVVPNGPAAKGGIEAGDVIVSVDGKTLKEKDHNSFSNLIGLMVPGTKTTIEIFREGQKKSLQVSIGVFPGSGDGVPVAKSNTEEGVKTQNPFGLAVSILDENTKAKYDIKSSFGVVVSGVVNDSPADKARLTSGDVITSANGKKISTPKDLEKILNSKEDLILLHIERSGEFYLVPLQR